MENLFFIINPVAGGHSCLKKFAMVESQLQQQGISYTALYSEYTEHASQLTRQAVQSGADCVVAVGGDGTAREVAQELLHTGVALGLLPFGTGNDLCKALQIPSDPYTCLDMLLAGHSRQIDTVTANGKVYINVAGFGFDVDVLEKTRLYKPRLRGIVPYILGLLHALTRLQHVRIQAITAQGELIQEEVFLVSVGNGNFIGGGMKVTPMADLADGLLDVCIVKKVRRMQVLQFLTRFIRGRHLDLDFVDYFRTTKLSVESSPCTPIQLDGEIIEQTPVVFQVLPGALSVIAGVVPTV